MFVFYDWSFPLHTCVLWKNVTYFPPFNSWLSFQRLCRLLWGYPLRVANKIGVIDIDVGEWGRELKNVFGRFEQRISRAVDVIVAVCPSPVGGEERCSSRVSRESSQSIDQRPRCARPWSGLTSSVTDGRACQLNDFSAERWTASKGLSTSHQLNRLSSSSPTPMWCGVA